MTPALGLVASISSVPCAFTFAVKSAAVPVKPPPAAAIPLRAMFPPVTPLFSLSTSKITDVPKNHSGNGSAYFIWFISKGNSCFSGRC